MTNLEKITKACHAANPDLRKLEWGCEVQTDKRPSPIVIKGFEDGSALCIDKEGYDFIAMDYEIKIIGKPIQLADVMTALAKNMRRPGDWIVDLGGIFWEIVGETGDDGWFVEMHKARWNLSQPLSGQSAETIDFIASIIN